MGEAAIVAVSGAIKALAELGVACINAKTPQQKEAEGAFWTQVLKDTMRIFGHSDFMQRPATPTTKELDK